MNCRLCGAQYPDHDVPAFCAHCGTGLRAPAPPQQLYQQAAQPPPAYRAATSPAPPGAYYAAAPPSGPTIDRAQLRAAIIRKRQLRKKLLLIAVPAGAVLVAVAVLATFFLFSGGGMSPEEYKKESMRPLKDTVSAMRGLEEEWEDAEISDDPYSECYEDMEEEVQETQQNVQEAMAVQAAIKPPGEMELLQQDLTGFYQEVSDFLGQASPDFAYAAKWAKVIEDWNDSDTAISLWDEDMSFEATINLINQDIESTDGYISRLASLNPTERFKSMQEKSLSLLADWRDLMERFKRAMINRDETSYYTVQAELETFDAAYDRRSDEVWASLDDFREEYYQLVDEGRDLQKELGGGQSSDTSSAGMY